jgi:replicative DNA helicase
MPAFDSTARKQAPPEPTFRTAPHNIEAEQALLGAILVNNEAFYRVSDFLEAKHFFEPIHQRIYELAGGLVRANKVATPVTLKTFPPRRRRSSMRRIMAALSTTSRSAAT